MEPPTGEMSHDACKDAAAGGGLILSACLSSLGSSSSGGGGRGRTSIAATASTRSPPGKRRRRIEPGEQHTGGGGAAQDSPPLGPLRVLLTTAGSNAKASGIGRGGGEGIGNRGATTACSSTGSSASAGRLLSSAAMDLAHSLAARSSSARCCRGCGGSGGGTTSHGIEPSAADAADGGSGGQSSQQQEEGQCQCIDVVYIAPREGEGGSGDRNPAAAGGDGVEGGGDGAAPEGGGGELGADLFPLRCRRVAAGAGPSAAIHRAEDSNNDDDDDDDDGGDGESSQPSSSWDEGALSRIQVRRVRDGADLVRYLATVPLLPPHQRPLRGIVVHDLGRILLGSASGDAAAAAGGGGPLHYTIDSSIVLAQIGKSRWMHVQHVKFGAVDSGPWSACV